MKDFKGKTAFVTGGASGIGLSISKALAKAGANIVIADFRQEGLDSALELFKENGWPAHGVLLDVMDREAYVRAADEAEAVFGNIHILINNAGVGWMEGPIWEAEYSDMDFVIDINFKSALNGIKTILPRILKHGEEGWVVSTSSKNALIPLGGMLLYNSTKRALMAAMETLAIDLRLSGANVGASVFCPGVYNTNLGQNTQAIRQKHEEDFGKGGKMKGATQDPDAPVVDPAEKFSMVRDPDDAGERVLRGIMRGDLFILTHSEWKKGWGEFADAVSRALPDEEPNEFFMKAFYKNVGNVIYNKQTQVPAYHMGDVYKEL